MRASCTRTARARPRGGGSAPVDPARHSQRSRVCVRRPARRRSSSRARESGPDPRGRPCSARTLPRPSRSPRPSTRRGSPGRRRTCVFRRCGSPIPNDVDRRFRRCGSPGPARWRARRSVATMLCQFPPFCVVTDPTIDLQVERSKKRSEAQRGPFLVRSPGWVPSRTSVLVIAGRGTLARRNGRAGPDGVVVDDEAARALRRATTRVPRKARLAHAATVGTGGVRCCARRAWRRCSRARGPRPDGR